MMTHAELVAKVEEARPRYSSDGADYNNLLNDYLDTLAAILALHTRDGLFLCRRCRIEYPCQTVDIVADALRKMGAIA